MKAIFVSVAGVALLAMPCHAITINTTFRSSGQSLSGFGTAGVAPANATGGGSLQTIMNTAADFWEAIFTTNFTLSIQYGWYPRTSSVATHNLVSQNFFSGRETSGSIAFDNDQSTVWFVDSTPTSHSEFSTYTEYTANLGGGTINVGKEYTGGSGSAANHDLLTTAIHEIGHALGLSGSNINFILESGDDEVDVVSPRPFPGTKVPLDDSHVNLDHALMRSSRPSGVRRLPSTADILANAEIGNWTVASGAAFSMMNFAAIPEPASGTMLASGILGLSLLRRRQRTAI